jgi:acyl dehydratase
MPDLAYDSLDLETTHGPYKYPLADRIERYLEAVQISHPWHTERSPWGPPVAPPSLLGTANMRFIDTIAPVPPGTLHAKQEVETKAALRRDRQPIAYGRFVEKYERRGRRWAVFEARYRDETGLLIGHSRTTIAFPEKVDTNDDVPGGRQTDAAPRKGELTPISRTLTQEAMTAYSEDSENAKRGSSIHVDPAVAKAAGFPATVAWGMMAADYISELMTGVFGKEWFENATLSVAFVKPILCGDTLTVNGRLKEATEDGAVVRKVYAVWAENKAGEAVVLGTAGSLVMPGG